MSLRQTWLNFGLAGVCLREDDDGPVDEDGKSRSTCLFALCLVIQDLGARGPVTHKTGRILD